MPLYLQNGKLLQKSGALGTSAGCCCGGLYTACDCSGSPVGVPASLSMDLTVDSLVSSFGSGCVIADARAFVEGTYVIPFLSSDASGAYYETTLANGLIIRLEWYCEAGINGTHLFSLRGCDISLTCFARASAVTSVTRTRLCLLTPGDTTPFSMSVQLFFVDGPLANCFINVPQSSYAITLTFTPSW
jgi:hypothetical protein